MSNGDIRYSSGSWVGNLYQKFEAVCQEVDDIVTHEHMKKLENQVQLVGDNVMKFCSNVKDLIPSFGAPVKHVAESVNSVSELKDGDGECPSVSDDLHSEDNLQNPSFTDPRSLSPRLKLVQSDSFLVNQEHDDSPFKEEKQSSEISEVIFTDSYFTDQSSEKQSPFDASELTCHGSSLITDNSDSSTKSEDESFSTVPELTFPDEDPCEMSTSSTFHNQNHQPGDMASIDVSPSAFKHISWSEFQQKEEKVHGNMVNDSILENSPGSEFQVKDEIVLDTLSKSFFDVSIENVPYSLLASSVTSSDSESSTVRLASSINSPLLDFSDHHEIEFHCTDGPTYNDMVVDIGSTSTSALASQPSEPFSCILSPKENTGDLDSSLSPSSSSLEFTEIPIISDSDNEGLELQRGKSMLDGSCIFVKNDSNHSVSPAVDRCWLRKKKIRGPFSSRKKLEKEYKQLAIWYCDIDAEFNGVSEEKPVSSSHNEHQSAQDLQESEWELV